ncbi:triacylglycerol lipase [Desulfobotulus alkaliphilus]|uniref:Triacylglycerol lipase n=1 Tax=Desulfobotulus alkaliphilus TaxID=622671 RepID=A0A562RN61_9BACT|nr:alpha/beta fold hydrolase [Desulfobotulus alkaliphilus]TWI70333.1 triacylglycerol lipase [Desulfobotulus alkaliphilus]
MHRKSLFLTAAFLLYAFIPAAHAKYDTRYPLVLAHGMGASAQIVGIMDYWGAIPSALERAGVEVYVTSVNGMDSTEAKAIDFNNQVLEILALSDAEKVNIIGHSHGTLYSRYAISNLGLAPFVASHTSIAGPHQGSRLADMIMQGVPGELHGLVGGAMDIIYALIMGDANPDSLANGWDVTTDIVQNHFNPNTLDDPEVYYQSWAAKAKWGAPSVLMQVPWLIMLGLEGANDGLVSVESAKWGEFRGVQKAAWYSPGCDHLNIVGMLFGITPGFDAPEFYKGIAADLKKRGH